MERFERDSGIFIAAVCSKARHVTGRAVPVRGDDDEMNDPSSNDEMESSSNRVLGFPGTLNTSDLHTAEAPISK
jgi:hypothetical protein